MREALARELANIARNNSKIVLLTGDHGYALFDEFQRAFPEQYINAGIAEQNMIGVAAGLAKAGFSPVVYGLSAFVPLRALEQIKLDVCYEQLSLLFLGDGAGVVYSTLGASHQCTEDIASLRALPNLSILSPADEHEMLAALSLWSSSCGPMYLRVGKSDLGTVHPGPVQYCLGELLSVRPGSGPVAFIATGSMVKTAIEVASSFPQSAVWSAPCIKPLHQDSVIALCRAHEALIVMEEHSVYAGLGSAITEISCMHAPAWICRIGIEDRFSELCGSYAYLMREHRLDAAAITRKVSTFLAERNLSH